jgi:hypothetical protein
VPVMLSVVHIVRRLRPWYERHAKGRHVLTTQRYNTRRSYPGRTPRRAARKTGIYPAVPGCPISSGGARRPPP